MRKVNLNNAKKSLLRSSFLISHIYVCYKYSHAKLTVFLKNRHNVVAFVNFCLYLENQAFMRQFLYENILFLVIENIDCDCALITEHCIDGLIYFTYHKNNPRAVFTL